MHIFYEKERNKEQILLARIQNICYNNKNNFIYSCKLLGNMKIIDISSMLGWEKTINSLTLEYDVDIYVTGSNAYLLSSELATLIAGRYVEIKMLPLSFKEYYGYYKESGKSKEDLFNEYLRLYAETSAV